MWRTVTSRRGSIQAGVHGGRGAGADQRAPDHSAASTSSRRGIPARAPAARVESDAAASAKATASRSGSPAASQAASAPLTVSPAPVVSTTSTGRRRQALAVEQRAVAAERDQHRRAGPRSERARRGGDVVLAGQPASLVGVRGQDHAVEPVDQVARGRGVQDRLPAGGARCRGAGGDRLRRHLVAEQHDTARSGLRGRDAAGLPPVSSGASAVVTASPVSAAFAPEATAIWFSPRSSTTITATPVATSSSRSAADDVDALGLELAQRLVAEVVGADGADPAHPRTGPRRRNRLVRALAAAVAARTSRR